MLCGLAWHCSGAQGLAETTDGIQMAGLATSWMPQKHARSLCPRKWNGRKAQPLKISGRGNDTIPVQCYWATEEMVTDGMGLRSMRLHMLAGVATGKAKSPGSPDVRPEKGVSGSSAGDATYERVGQ